MADIAIEPLVKSSTRYKGIYDRKTRKRSLKVGERAHCFYQLTTLSYYFSGMDLLWSPKKSQQS